MRFSWRELQDDLALAVHAIGARWIEVLPALCVAALAWVLGEGLRYGESSAGFVHLVGLVALVVAEAYVMRVFGPVVGRPVGEPRRSEVYLLWAALWTGWPVWLYMAVALVIDLTVANAVPSLQPRTAAGSILSTALFAPAYVLATIQGWAFSYVAVDGATATDATANVLHAVNRTTFVRAVVIAVLLALVGMPFWFGLHGFAARFGPLPAAAASAVTYVVLYIVTYAVWVTTRPAVPAITAVPYEASAAQT
ncbi:MAG: hypothetical protein JWM87_2155 [Candidatus Eremiobacteraeota bacterium]|nr:hypothetical protein [Candidatus Eremiobacteraeota bacterium]